MPTQPTADDGVDASERAKAVRNAGLRMRYATDPAYRQQLMDREARYRLSPEVRARKCAAQRAYIARVGRPKHIPGRKKSKSEKEKAQNRTYMRERWKDGNYRMASNANRAERRDEVVYGLTVGQRKALLDAQGGVCAICAGVNASGNRLALDHDHATGKVRGLLCHSCNVAIGHAKESPARLESLAKYLRLHSAIQSSAVTEGALRFDR